LNAELFFKKVVQKQQVCGNTYTPEGTEPVTASLGVRIVNFLSNLASELGACFVPRLFAPAALFVICVSVSQAANLSAQWTRSFGASPEADRSYGVATDFNGNVVVTGEVFSPTFSNDMATVKYDSAGNLLWSRVYDTGNWERGHDVKVDFTGNVFVSGLVDGPTAGQFNRNRTLIKYDPAGTVLWVRARNTLSGGGVSQVAVDPSGNVFTTGYIEVTKWDTNGAVIWERDTSFPGWG
jgi:hypothetical protein